MALLYEYAGLDTVLLYLQQTGVEPKAHVYRIGLEDERITQALDINVYTLQADTRFRAELVEVAKGMR